MGNIIAAFLFGVVAKDAFNLWLHWWMNRPRPFVTASNFRDPCGPSCAAKEMSKIGWRERTTAEIDRLAARIHARLYAHEDADEAA